MKKFLFLVISFFTLSFVNVKGAVLPDSGFNFVINNKDLPVNFSTASGGYSRPTVFFYNLSEVDVFNAKFNYVIIDVCSGNLMNSTNVSIENSGTRNYFDSNSLLIYNTGLTCQSQGYNAILYKIQMKVGKYVDSEGDGLFSSSYLKFINSYGYPTFTTFKSVVVSDEDILTGLLQNNITNDLQRDILNQQKENNKRLDDINKNQQDTNKKLDDVKGAITSEENPKLEGLNNSAGWLPPGPLDSILNLPLSFLNNLSTNLSKTCQPITLPLPFVDKTLDLPCLNTIYSQIEGLDAWIIGISVIASVFILFTYLINLYKWVDDTLTFRENNYIDNWGGM